MVTESHAISLQNSLVVPFVKKVISFMTLFIWLRSPDSPFISRTPAFYYYICWQGDAFETCASFVSFTT